MLAGGVECRAAFVTPPHSSLGPAFFEFAAHHMADYNTPCDLFGERIMHMRKFSFDPSKGKTPRNFYVRLGFKSSASGELVEGTRTGLKVSAFDVLIKELAIQRNDGLRLVGMSAKTLERRVKTNHLNTDESDRIYRVASVFEAAIRLFMGDEELAKKWLKEPSKALSGDTPLDRLDTEAGADEVKDLIGKLEHGVIV